MKLHPSITEERIYNTVAQDDSVGFCTKCGDDAYGVEPDAERYECESCGAHAVYGAEQLLFHVGC
jgi:hypothetical protein